MHPYYERQRFLLRGKVVEVREDNIEGAKKIVLQTERQTVTFRTIRKYDLGDELVLQGRALPGSIEVRIPETRLTEVTVHSRKETDNDH